LTPDRDRPALFLSMHWSGEQDGLTVEQVALHKSHLARLTDEQLLNSYRMCVRALGLDGGKPPAAAKVQYYVERWRELRRRRCSA
jgi:hypothetical protein